MFSLFSLCLLKPCSLSVSIPNFACFGDLHWLNCFSLPVPTIDKIETWCLRQFFIPPPCQQGSFLAHICLVVISYLEGLHTIPTMLEVKPSSSLACPKLVCKHCMRICTHLETEVLQHLICTSSLWATHLGNLPFARCSFSNAKWNRVHHFDFPLHKFLLTICPTLLPFLHLIDSLFASFLPVFGCSSFLVHIRFPKACLH